MQIPLAGKKKSTPWILAIATLGVVGMAVAVPIAMRKASPPQNLDALTVQAAAKDVTVQIAASGEVVPVKTVNLNPKTAGILEERLVKQGDRVRAGQLIARMENRSLQAQLAQAQADLDKARAGLDLVKAGTRPEEIDQAASSADQTIAQVKDAEAKLSLATEQLRRNRGLADAGAISRDSLDQFAKAELSARADLEQAQARLTNANQKLRQQQNGPRIQEIAQAAAQVKSAEAQVQAINTQLEDTFIRAPFAGIITQTQADNGAFVTPTSFSSNTGSATLVATLASDLEIVAKVPEVDIGQIKPGQLAEIRTDAYPKQVFKGAVRLIAPEAIEDSTQRGVRTFEVRVRILDGKEKLRSKMTIDLKFLGEKLANALIVPTVAIVTNKGQTGVLVVGADQKPKFKPVTIGPNIGNETQIMDGIESGEAVFVALPEGQKLETIIKGMDDKK
jgi:HlyD family secretion protein